MSDEEKKFIEIRKVLYALRPFSLFPKPYGPACSVLCNHPHGLRFSWIAKRLSLLSLFTGQEDVPPPVRRIKNISHDVKLKENVRKTAGSPSQKAAPFSFLKEYREIYEIPKSALVEPVNSTAGESPKQPKTKKKKKKNKLRIVASPTLKRKKSKAKKKMRKVVKEQATVVVEESQDEDLAVTSSLALQTIRKRRTTEKKKVLYTDLENPSTLVEKDLNLDGKLRIDENFDEQYDEIDDGEFDPKKLQALQLLLNSSSEDQPTVEKKQRQSNPELKNIKDEINTSIVGVDNLLRYPKVPSVLCCRFELPMDTSILCDLKPLDYLKQFCIIPSKRKKLCENIFAKFRTAENKIVNENIFKAMSDAYGKSVMSLDQYRAVCALVNLGEDCDIGLDEFVGLVSLTERYLCHSLSGTRIESKDTIEEMDFNYFATYTEGIQIQESLKQLLFWIKNS